MICTADRLTDALNRYQNYRATASNSLVRSRAVWIPVIVDNDTDRVKVIMVANAVLEGLDYQVWLNQLVPAHQLGVALLVMEGWANHLNDNPLSMGEAHLLTERVFKFLALLNIDWQAIAVRNWCSLRDGGRVDFGVVKRYYLTTSKLFVDVFVQIRRHWDGEGYDYKRRDAS